MSTLQARRGSSPSIRALSCAVVTALANIGPAQITPARLGEPRLPNSLGCEFLALADFDCDKDLDILVSRSTAGGMELALWRNDGTGRFEGASPESGTKLSHPLSPFLVSPFLVADLDGDGDLDVVIGRGLQLLINDGKGFFSDLTEKRISRNIDTARGFSCGDIDGDADPDLVVDIDGRYEILLNDGKGSYIIREDGSSSRLSQTVISLADFDGDGDLDLLDLPDGSSELSVSLNRGRGEFEEPRIVSGRCTASGFLIMDTDGDGDLDIVAGVSVEPGKPGSLRWFENVGKCTFRLAREDSVVETAGPLTFLHTVDLNGDGKLEILALGGGKTVSLFGDGPAYRAEPLTLIPDLRDLLGRPRDLLGLQSVPPGVGDVNSDGKPDLVFGGGPGVDLYFGCGRNQFAQIPSAGRVGAPQRYLHGQILAHLLAAEGQRSATRKNLFAPDWWEREKAAKAMGSPRFASGIPQLQRALRDEEERVRSAALASLALCGPEAAPLFLTELKKAKPRAEYFQHSLGASLAPAVPSLVRYLKGGIRELITRDTSKKRPTGQPEYSVSSAIGCLGGIGPGATDAVGVLIDLLEAKTRENGELFNGRTSVYEALSAIGPVDKLAYFKKVARDTSHPDATRAVGLLVVLSTKKDFLDAIRGGDESKILEKICALQSVLPQLESLLIHASAKIRLRAIDAYSSVPCWNRASLVPALWARVDDEDPEVGSQALLALERLGGDAFASFLDAVDLYRSARRRDLDGQLLRTIMAIGS